jgi:DNA primase
MIKESSIKEVMERASIVEVVGQFVRLKKRGSNYIANCPFHHEKSPSFSVSQPKGIYKCFGCGKAGNVVSFVQEHEKMTYPEAIKWLAEYYKITLEETETSPEVKIQQQAGEAIRIINEFAAQWFHQTLLQTEEGQLIGLSYFKQRGFRDEVIQKFKLGFNPEQSDAFYQAAYQKGYNRDLLEKAGLIKKRNEQYYDSYRGRVIFPIQNMTGRIIGFGARLLKSNDKAPKYINTPENELYLKSKTLYGMYQSRMAIAKQDECFLVEGYTDVISLHQGGVENVVSSSGTSLTEDQLRMIGQLTKNLTILYDGDPAGIKAALRGLDMALSQSFNVQLVLLPDGEDPDSFIQKNGAAKYHEYVQQHKQDVISFKLAIGLQETGEDPIKRSKLVNDIAESISKINKAEDFSLQNHYIKLASTKLKVDETGLLNLVNKHIREHVEQTQKGKYKEAVLPDAPMETVPQEEPASSEAPSDQYEWEILRVLIEYGAKPFDENTTVAQYIYERLDPELIQNTQVSAIYVEYYQLLYHQNQQPDSNFYLNYHDANLRQTFASLLHPPLEISPNWVGKYGIESIGGEQQYITDVESTLTYYDLKKIILIQQQLMDKISQEENPLKQEQMLIKFQELRLIEREILKRHKTVVFKSVKH